MKKAWILGLWLAALCLPVLADDFSFASRVLEFVKAGQGDSICARLHPSLAGKVGPEAFSAVFAQLEAQLGPLAREGEWSAGNIQGYRKDSRRMTFGETPLLFTLVSDSTRHIMALTFTPAPAEPETQTATDSFVERELAVEHANISLPATLCLPASVSGGPVPVIVLVHGSGPNDRDETLGPNKPFRELAHRLAACGIATLRYEKRTRVYSSRLSSVFPVLNYDTEVVEDACAAIRIAAEQEGVDSARVFVLGHSLGGSLAPRIVRRSPLRVAGAVLMAGAARPFDEMLYDQLLYVMHSVAGLPKDSVKTTYEEMLAAMPASYLQSVRKYVATAEAQAARSPMLILQGGHDYQVTRRDFDLWQEALAGRDDVEFVWLPECDHLMRALPAMAVPADYMRALPMSEEAVRAIAGFVQEH